LTTDRPKILVVCGRNKRRSRTAEHIFKNDSRFQIRSAGLSSQSEVQISEKLINWADIIFVMDNGQRNRINNQYRSLDIPKIENLDISDDYEYLDSVLIDMLTKRINGTLKIVYGI
jgi:protein-tyrosine phosphatase